MSVVRRLGRGLIGAVVALLVSSLAVMVGTPPAGAVPDAREHTPKRQQDLSDGSLAVTIATPDEDGTVYGYVSVYRWDETAETFEWFTSEWPNGDSPQTVRWDLPPGQYYAEMDVYDGPYISPAYLNGATRAAVVPTDDGVVEVTAGAETAASIDLLGSAEITGYVVDEDDDEVDGVTVSAHRIEDPLSEPVGSTEVWYGEFYLTVPAGTYEIRITDEDDRFETYTHPTPVEVVTGQELDLGELRLAPLPVGVVTGSVASHDGPVADAMVVLLRLDGDPASLQGWRPINQVYTESDGSYQLPGVVDGREYTVAAMADGLQLRFLGDVAEIGDATRFPGAASVSVDPIMLPPASVISGVVSTPDDEPSADVEVVLYRWSEDDGGYFTAWDDDYTGEDGRFRFGSLSPGHYTLRFYPSDPALEPAWLVGEEMPEAPGAGTIEVGEEPAEISANKQLSYGARATGTVVDGGLPVAGAGVTAYVWDGDEDYGYWDQWSTVTSKADGTFAVPVPRGERVTVRVSRAGYRSAFLGGGSTLPELATAGNSVVVDADEIPVGDFELEPRPTTLGKVAGESHAWCRTHALAPNDDGSSDVIELPFRLKFFGLEYDELYVNNNGNVTFGSDQSTYTPDDLTGETDRPIIAPFFADVDTRGDSDVVSYGLSPDGKQLCVTWADVAYYDQGEHLNTFQLILTSNETAAGRQPGDFDIRFNYDQILWEAGEASGADSDGLGGTSAAVGFSNGTGVPGTYVQLPGSFVNGALLDGGPQALISGSQASTQPGRYNFQVRNGEVFVAVGGVEGEVIAAADDSPIADAYVQICRPNGTGCSYTETNDSGHYSFTALTEGDYRVTVWSPSEEYFSGGAAVSVVGGEIVTVPTIALAAPRPIPSNAALNGSSPGEVPSVYYAEPITLQVTGCPGVDQPQVSTTLANGTVIHDAVPMTESPAGTYTATLAQFYPHTGAAAISTNVPTTCGSDPVAFNVYIDPAGIVTDQFGRPIPGAEVTLSRSEEEHGIYEDVPEGSDIMSPSNRANPTITDAVGFFKWDVISGWYKVAAVADDCQARTSPAMEVPPERLDLVLKLTCEVSAPVPSTSPTLSGTGKAGTRLTATAATWPAPLAAAGLQWLRNGKVDPSITGTSYTVRDADVGDTFAVRSLGQRPDYVTDGGAVDGPPLVVTFDAVRADSAAIRALAADKVASAIQLKVKKKVRAPKRAKATVTVTARGAVPTGKVTLRITGKSLKRPKTTSLTLAGGRGVVKLPKLKKGTYTVTATYAGDTKALGSQTKAKVKVKAKKASGKKGKATKAKVRRVSGPLLAA